MNRRLVIVGLLISCNASSAPYRAPYLKDCVLGALYAAMDGVRLRSQYQVGPEFVPKWEDIDQVDRLISAVQFELQQAQLNGHLTETKALLRTLHIDVRHLDLTPTPFDQPTVRDLRRHFLAKLKYLYQITGAQRPEQWPRLGPSDRRARIIEGGRMIVKTMEAQWNALFPTTGFPSKEAFGTHLKEYGSDLPALSLLRNGGLAPSMNRPESGRWWIHKVGFHNQHVTGSTGGYKGTPGRNRVEATRSGTELLLYETLDSEIKPVYGSLQRSPVSGEKQYFSHYGVDTYVFKESKLKDRMTYTIGDSLIHLRSRTSSHPIREGAFMPDHWDQVFIPWSDIEFSTPFLGTSVEQSLDTNVDAALLGHTYPFVSGVGPEYLEIQFWGGLRLSDVETFVFLETPPQGDFLRALQRNNIKIFRRDQATYTLLPWTPPGEAP